MPISSIIFDLGNVLVFFDQSKALRALANYVNPLTAMLLWARKEEFLKELRAEADLLETGRLSLAQFYSRLKGKIGLTIDLDGFQKIWNDIFSPNEPVLALAQQLSSHYPCYIFSNTNASHYEFVKAHYPALSFAKGWSVSHELGVMKPAHEFFERALAQHQLSPATSLFIDDLEPNVAAARSVGLDAIHYQSPSQLLSELGSRGITAP
ncbi:MAG: HAD family phosphatase [bacterium]|nr:HAD family phosphatase [bacterium]